MLTYQNLPHHIPLKISENETILVPKSRITIRSQYLTIPHSVLPGQHYHDICLKLSFAGHPFSVTDVLKLLNGKSIDNPAAPLLSKEKQIGGFTRTSVLYFKPFDKYEKQTRPTTGVLYFDDLYQKPENMQVSALTHS